MAKPKRIDFTKVDRNDPRFFELDPTNPNTNIAASTFDPTDPTSRGNPVGEKYNEWLQTAEIGDKFDWGKESGDPTQKGLVNEFVGFNKMGTPIIKTNVSEERADWRGAIEGAGPGFGAQMKALMNTGRSETEARFLLAQYFDPEYVTQNLNATSGNWAGSGTTGSPLTFNGVPYSGTRNGAVYVNGVLKTDSTGNNGGITTGSGTPNDPLLVNGKLFTGVLGGVNYANGVSQQSTAALTAADIETKSRRTAQQDFRAALGELGLADLADEVDRMIKEDFTVSQIKMELPKTSSYQLRFPGMKALRDSGRAINEATYISNEKGYLQTLRAYGLDTSVLGTRSALGTYIANEVSPREFEERVNLASTRVNENPDVLETFKSFYPEVDKSGVITYLLNPKAGMAIIKKQVRTSEIGAAAASAGFARDLMGISNIETLLPAVGEQAYAGLRTEFQRARQLAQSQRRLAQIENQSYSDLEAIGAVVGDDAAKMLASERRAQREAARFSARGGVTGASLASTTAI